MPDIFGYKGFHINPGGVWIKGGLVGKAGGGGNFETWENSQERGAPGLLG